MVAVYPGTFDPLTNGHLDILERAASIADRLFVAVLNNLSKKSLFSFEERVAHIQAVSSHLQNVEALPFNGLQVDLAQKLGAKAIIRGLRGAADMDHELSMSFGNHFMNAGIVTLFIPANPAYIFISSSLVKEIAVFGGDVTGMVPPLIHKELNKKIHREG